MAKGKTYLDKGCEFQERTLYVQDDSLARHGYSGPETYRPVSGAAIVIQKKTTARAVLGQLRSIRVAELKNIGCALTCADQKRQRALEKYDRVSKQLDEVEGLIND